VNDVLVYFRDLGRLIASAWNAFFFRPADPTALGLIRLCVGALGFWSLLVYGLDLHAFLGSEGWVDPDALRLIQGREKPLAWSFWNHVPDQALRPVWVASLAILFCFTVGLGSRLSAVLAWVILTSTVRRAPVSQFGFDQALTTWTFYLAVTGASGQAVSLDRFLSRWRTARAEVAPGRRRTDGRWPLPSGVPTPTVSANLALRLIQLHLCLIYGMAGLAKFQGAAWWNGLAIWGTLASAEFRVIDFTWLAAYPYLLNVMTHGALALETAYPALIWVRPLRPLTLGLIVVLHVGIGLTAPGLSVFAMAMIAANLAFVSGPWLRSLVTGEEPGTPAGRVLYDGACPRCRASMALITAADPDRLVEPVDLTTVDVKAIHPSLTPERCLAAMHMVGANGRVWVGYDALAAIGRWLPLFWPCGVLGTLPGVTWVGRRAYNALAASRPREVCNDEVCGLHPAQSRRDRPSNSSRAPADSPR
jgi:predicted DCC family thiol-disulfide oxidoreductase YuxK